MNNKFLVKELAKFVKKNGFTNIFGINNVRVVTEHSFLTHLAQLGLDALNQAKPNSRKAKKRAKEVHPDPDVMEDCVELNYIKRFDGAINSSDGYIRVTAKGKDFINWQYGWKRFFENFFVRNAISVTIGGIIGIGLTLLAQHFFSISI